MVLVAGFGGWVWWLGSVVLGTGFQGVLPLLTGVFVVNPLPLPLHLPLSHPLPLAHSYPTGSITVSTQCGPAQKHTGRRRIKLGGGFNDPP